MPKNAFKSQIDAAAALGISSRQLRSWAVADWFPKDGRGADGWDVEAISKARDAEGLKGSTIKAERRGRRDALERVNLKIAQSKLIRLQMEREREEAKLFPRAAAVLIQNVVMDALAKHAAELPGIASAKAGPAERAKIEEETRRAMDSFVHSIGQQFDAAMAAWDQGHF